MIIKIHYETKAENFSLSVSQTRHNLERQFMCVFYLPKKKKCFNFNSSNFIIFFAFPFRAQDTHQSHSWMVKKLKTFACVLATAIFTPKPHIHETIKSAFYFLAVNFTLKITSKLSIKKLT